jgi:predicted nucleotidyltransferase
MSAQASNDKISHARSLIENLEKELKKENAVLAFIVYGSYSDKNDHQPTGYSDVDLEIIVKDEAYKQFLKNFRSWFEEKFEPVLLETSVSHLNKIFLTKDFLDLQFYISKLSEFDNLEERELNYFPSGYTIHFDKTDTLDEKIKSSLQPFEELLLQVRFNKLNNAFWYFVQGTTPYLRRREYWFAAAGYWAWLYVILCKIIRIYYGKEVEDNPMKHIEQALPNEIIDKIQPLRNLETPDELKTKMQLLVDIYSEYAQKISKEHQLNYNTKLETEVREYIKQYLIG